MEVEGGAAIATVLCAIVLGDLKIQGGPKESVFSKNENRPWWGFFGKKSMTNIIK